MTTATTTSTASRKKAPGARAAPRKAAAATRPELTGSEALPAPPQQEMLEGPTREDLVRRRAFDLYERNGRVDGSDIDNWLAAESEIGSMALEATAPSETRDAG